MKKPVPTGAGFAIPPLKLRGALTGTYLHLIEGTGNVVLGPSEISLKATDVGLVGVGKAGQIIDSFGYSLKLNGQERDYKGTTYKGIYFGGSEELKLNLPNKTIDAIVLDSGIGLGAFGGVKAKAVSGRDRVEVREKILKDYETGSTNVLCACDLLNEGWDSPHTTVLFMARPTMSKTIYLQQLGRGTRRCPGKDDLLVIDFVDNANMFNMP